MNENLFSEAEWLAVERNKGDHFPPQIQTHRPNRKLQKENTSCSAQQSICHTLRELLPFPKAGLQHKDNLILKM